MPPPNSAALPEKVLLVTVAVPVLKRAPPTPPWELARLPENVQLVTVSVPALLTPAREAEVPLAIVRFVRARVTPAETLKTPFARFPLKVTLCPVPTTFVDAVILICGTINVRYMRTSRGRRSSAPLPDRRAPHNCNS